MRLLKYLIRALSLMVLFVVCYWLGNLTYPYLLMTFGPGVSAATGALGVAYVPLMILYFMDKEDD